MRDKYNNTKRRHSLESTASQLSVYKRNDRRASNTSVDSRVVAEELANQEEHEVLGILHDVQGFLKRPEGLPNYISKTDLFLELVKIWKNPSVSPEKKAEAIDTSAHLLKVISGKKSRKKNSHSTIDVSNCLDIVLPPAICQLTSKEPFVQQSSLSLIQQCIQDDDPNGNILQVTIEHLADNGVRHKSDKISLETIKLLPGIYLQEIDDINLDHIFNALYDQLEAKNRDEYAFSALLRHREVLGPDGFYRYSNKIDVRQKNTFKRMESSHENRDFHLSKKRSREGVSFGMIPNTIINRLLDKQNRTMRAEGAVMLKRELENGADSEQWALLLPYTGSFIKFLGNLLSDASPKVIFQILECHDILLNNAPQAMRQHVVQVVHNLLKISCDAKVQIKIELFNLMKAVMLSAGPQVVVDVLMPEIDHKNARMREDVINFIIFALLTFPSKEFDMLEICASIVPAVIDTKRRVRQAGLECISTIHQCIGKKNEQLIWECIQDMDKGLYDDDEEIIEATHYRLSRKVLPRITDEGYIEYGLQIPHNYQTRAANNAVDSRNSRNTNSNKKSSSDFGPDVNWILRGSGSVSRGSAGSLNHSLGVNGASGQIYGSNVSLQSFRNSDSSGSTRSTNTTITSSKNNDTNRRRRSSSTGTTSGSTGSSSSIANNWNRKYPIPKIRTTESSAGGKNNASENNNNNHEHNNILEDEKDVGNARDDQTHKQVARQRSASHDGRHPDLTQIEDVENVIDERNHIPQEDDEQIRQNTYGTIPRSISEVSLQSNPKRKNSLPSVSEDNDLSTTTTSTSHSSPTRTENEKKHENNSKPMSFKKHSMADVGLAKPRETQFDEEENGLEDGEAPGAFKRPTSAYKLAKTDLNSAHWQTEIEGLGAIVRLMKYHSDIILVDVNDLIHAVNHECKNLRSQVTRAAIQTFVIMFSLLGKDIETSKSLEATLQLLLTKTADTNRFIRYDTNEALDAFSEHCTLHKVINSLERLGVNHKNVVARTASGRILANLAETLGNDTIWDASNKRDSREAVEILYKSAAQLLNDGSLDVRQEAKRIFSILMENPMFEKELKKNVSSNLVRKIRKSLDTLAKQLQEQRK